MIRARIATVIVLTLSGLLAAPALGAWSVGGSGAAAGAATTMPAGNIPTASASGSSVTVSWSTAMLADGTAVAGYIVKRYDAASGAAATVGAGCSGTVTITSCTEQSVPAGSWVYTDTPVQDNWTGAESAAGQPVTAQALAAQTPAQTLGLKTARPTSTASPTHLSSAGVNFGYQPVGEIGRARDVMLTNSSSAPLTTSSVRIHGANAADFTTRFDRCSHKALKPHRWCTVQIIFIPSGTGRRSARLSVGDSASPRAATVALSGTGVKVAGLTTGRAATPASVPDEHSRGAARTRPS